MLYSSSTRTTGLLPHSNSNYTVQHSETTSQTILIQRCVCVCVCVCGHQHIIISNEMKHACQLMSASGVRKCLHYLQMYDLGNKMAPVLHLGEEFAAVSSRASHRGSGSNHHGSGNKSSTDNGTQQEEQNEGSVKQAGEK